jgi:exodeoxyribonuclease-5
MTLDNEIVRITHSLEFTPTNDQVTAIRHLAAFGRSVKTNPLYLLKGYAGTGKTSLISAFVKNLHATGRRFVLLAPTGRAAKVLSQYTGFQAHTIHRKIYHTLIQKDGRHSMRTAVNKMHHTVFIVDEASMISDQSQDAAFSGNGNSLLDDLISFVFSQSGNRLLLVGDLAQLPPVGLSISPALDIQYLQSAFNLTAFSFEMTQVMRQAMDSGILSSATFLREKIHAQDCTPPFFKLRNFRSDVNIIEDGYMLEELMQTAFSGQNDSESIVVTRSNKSANRFNQQVRQRIQLRENELEAGDELMVVKNNYFWLGEGSKAGFIANGDLASVVRVNRMEELYGFKFAEAEIRLTDYPDEKELTVKLLLDTLDAPGPGLSPEDRQRFFDEIEKDYLDIPNRRKRLAEIQKNPYFNALHIKFAYAMTCHKTQGGQWPVVFIEQGYITDENLNIEYLRWLYTAFTRATSQVYLLNFNSEFFE